MVLTEIQELASGFEGCEKKVEIDFHIQDDQHDLRRIPRDSIDHFCSVAKCTVISTRKNEHFDSYLLSESSLFIFKTKIILKTCGTTKLLLAVKPILDAAKLVGAVPDFLQFSRSNFMFPQKQHFPHRAFSEETEYLNELTGKQGISHTLGSLQGQRWHLYIVDFNEVDASAYKQQTCELIMFNLDPRIMKQFYQAEKPANNGEAAPAAAAAAAAAAPAPMDEECKEERLVNSSGQGFANLNGEGSKSGDDATKKSGIDKLLPGSDIDAFLFNPCGYSANGLLGETYFTIHITPEPECSFVSFETNHNTRSFTALVNQVTHTFRPGSFCLSLFVDEESLISDSRKGLDWNKIEGYTASSNTHHTFQSGYNATCAHYEITAEHAAAVGSSSFGVPAASAAAAVRKAADNFDEHTALATQKLQAQLSDVVEKAKAQEALNNKLAHEKDELARALEVTRQEMAAKVAALEAKLAASAAAGGASSSAAAAADHTNGAHSSNDASMGNDKKRARAQ